MEKLTVILDLDSTVISSLDPTFPQPKVLKGHKLVQNGELVYIVYERPYLQPFLNFLFRNFNVGVWTAGNKEYAEFIATNILCGSDRKLSFLFHDIHVTKSKSFSNCTKDLELVFSEYPHLNKNNTIIIDDFEGVYSHQKDNAYLIPVFTADSVDAQFDIELVKLANILGKNILS